MDAFEPLCGGFWTYILLLQAEEVKEKKNRKELAAIINAVMNANKGTGKRKGDNKELREK